MHFGSPRDEKSGLERADDAGRPRLIDSGASRVVGGCLACHRRLEAGMIVNLPRYEIEGTHD